MIDDRFIPLPHPRTDSVPPFRGWASESAVPPASCAAVVSVRAHVQRLSRNAPRIRTFRVWGEGGIINTTSAALWPPLKNQSHFSLRREEGLIALRLCCHLTLSDFLLQDQNGM